MNNKIIVFLILFLFFAQFSFSQEITESNYLKADKEIWDEYERESEKVMEVYKLHPEKKDSLMMVSERISKIADLKNQETAIKYASTPSGLKRLFMVRLNLSKDTLNSILTRIPKEMQNSPYGKSILAHIETEQIVEGSQYFDFEAKDKNNKEFKLSSFEGKNVLLLYGGLDCMGKGGRDFLSSLYKKTSRDNFEIVVFWTCSGFDKLNEVCNTYPDYINVSDFLQDSSPFKIKYGCQATPTCYLINKDGIVILKSVGLPDGMLNTLLENNKLD